MSEEPIIISNLNDFVFCPVSIYFHQLYDGVEKTLYQNSDQINGTKAHESVDNATYRPSSTLCSVEVFSEKYNLIGKIDIYEKESCTLIERKKKIKTIYDGYVFQIYAQYFAFTEMGYPVRKLIIRSMDDNKNYFIPLPKDDQEMFEKFEKVIRSIEDFDFDSFHQNNVQKCQHCIYEPYCDRGLAYDEC